MTRHRSRFGALAGVIGAGLLVLTPAPAAHADPVSAASASSYGATISAGGQQVIPPTPTASVDLPPGGESSDTLVDIPAAPLAVSGTLNADAAAHEASDVNSALTVVSQDVEGPYNATGVGLVEGLNVLLDTPTDGVSLVTADAVRAEAVGVCQGDTVKYSANSEIVNLKINGTDVPLNDPVQQLLDGLHDALVQSGLNAVVDVQRNVVTPTADGISVDGLVVTVLAAAGDTPVAEVHIAHAEVNGLACGAATPKTECNDGVDNDNDTKIDYPDDPGCESATDNSEADQAAPECSDTVDNDNDGKVDYPDDPGCTSATDDSEIDTPAVGDQTTNRNTALPYTGSESGPALFLAGGLAILAYAAHRLRQARLN